MRSAETALVTTISTTVLFVRNRIGKPSERSARAPHSNILGRPAAVTGGSCLAAGTVLAAMMAHRNIEVVIWFVAA